MERTLGAIALLGLVAVAAGCSRETPMTHPRPDARTEPVTVPRPEAEQAEPTPPERGASGHKGYAAAREALEKAEVARAKGELEPARAELLRALAELGKDYAPPGVVDDTSLKLAAADELWDKGRREDSISTTVNMLRTRLRLYTERHADAPRDPRKLELVLAVDPPSSKRTAPLKLVLTLKNAGDAPVVVNQRLALNSPHVPDSMREVVLDVHGPDGKLRPYQLKMKMGAPEARHVRTLSPRESLSNEYELHSGWDLSTPGEYRVRALYESAPVANATGEPVWTVAVFSEELRFSRQP